MLLIHEILKAQSKSITSKFQHPEKTIVLHNILAYVFLVLLKCRRVPILKQQINGILGSVFILLSIPQYLMSTYYMLSTMTDIKMTKMSKKTISFPWHIP